VPVTTLQHPNSSMPARLTMVRSLFQFRTRSWVALFCASALLLIAAPLALDAQGTTTGVVRGRVVDQANTAIPEVTVTVTNEETGLVRGALTDADGIYNIRLLPPGIYRVQARRIGLQEGVQNAVRVVVGTTTPVNFTLQVVAVQLTGVQVIAQAQVDVTDAGVRQTVSQEEIAALPTLGRDFTDFIALSGMVSPTPEETTGGQFSIAGQRPSQTNLQIDGVDANQAFFGENRGGSRIPFAFSLESIREFQIITNGFDVEFGNYTGGVVNLVTRSGTNNMRGSLYANYRGDNTTGPDFLGRPVNDFEVQQFAASADGPIIRDRLFFLASVDAQRRREPITSISRDYFENLATPQADRADSLDRFVNILENVYGIPNAGAGYGQYSSTNDVLVLFGRLDWNVNDRHRLSVRNNFSNYSNANEAGSFVGGISTAETLRDKANSAVAELTSTLRPNLFNVFRAQFSYEGRPRVPNTYYPEMVVGITPNQTARYGGSFISFANNVDETKLQLINNATGVFGNHTIKVGTNNIFAWLDNTFWLGGSGAYQFDNLEAFEQMRPSVYTRNLRADRQAPRAKFAAQEYSVYAQDDWQMTPRVLGSFGLRYDVARYGDRPMRVIDIERAFGFPTGIAPVDRNNISPRAAITFDVHGDASSVIRVGTGLFYGRVPYVLGSNVGITEMPLLSLQCRGSLAEGDVDAPPVPNLRDWSATGSDNPFECLGGSLVQGVPEYSFWNENFEIPETFKGNLGYERRLGAATRAKFDVVYTESRKLYTVRNMNLRSSFFTLDGEGGRQVFAPPTNFNPANAAGPDRLVNTDFGNVYVNYNDGVSRSTAASVELSHQFAEGTQLRGSYTWMNAYDNTSFSCCTSNAGYRDARIGAFGPNLVGAPGDEDAGWGPSNFLREHTVVFSGFTRLPYDFRFSGIWRVSSGRPWGPEQSGDLNADGERFNDRPYIFRPRDLPVYVAPSVTDPAQRNAIIAGQRALYAEHLENNECVARYQGQIIPRNTCRQPWFNSLDVSLRRNFTTVGTQNAELTIDVFNVLNLLNRDWGRNMQVSGGNRNLVTPQAYNAATNQIEYTVPSNFGNRGLVGFNLIQQYSAQVGVRYSF
jgi:hypothetical protein